MQNSDSASTTRKRRFRYTYVACEKCKDRKSKCSGEQPCSRCREANLICVYSRTTRFRHPRRSSNTATVQNAQPHTARAVNRQPDQTYEEAETESFNAAQPPQGTEPTNSSPLSVSSRNDSFEHCLRLVESRFAASRIDSSSTFSPGRRTARFGSDQMRQAVARRKSASLGSVLEVFEVDSWIQVLQIYEEEIGLQYPCIDIRYLSGRICQVKSATSQPGAPNGPAAVSGQYGDRTIDDIAFLLLAIISGFTDPTALDVANPHIEEICGNTLRRTHLATVDLDDLRLLILACMFFFLSDREKQAWRVTGLAMRLLHELTTDSDSGDHAEAIPDGMFWTVYTLDRRWSFGTGLPFAVQDVDITRRPPSSKEGDLSSAYLAQMVVFCGIASEVRSSFLNNPSTCRATLDAARDLVHFRIVQWQQNLPDRLQFHGTQDRFNPAREKRGDYKLRLMLYLRANIMRTIILRKSATRFGLGELDETSAQSMAQVAHDSIRVLSLLVQDTDIYHAQHKTFNHFLEAALSALLLVMCSGGDADGNGLAAGISLGPAKTTSYLRDIVEATELVQRMAACSPVTQRLKEKLQGIQKFIDAMMVSTSRSGGFQRDPEENAEGTVTYWNVPGSTNDAASSTNQENPPRQHVRGAVMPLAGPHGQNPEPSNHPLGSAHEPAPSDMPASSAHYHLINNSMYTQQAVDDMGYVPDGERAGLVHYGAYMSIPGTAEAMHSSMPSNMFTARMMENALADVGISALSDLNGILMDYDNLLF